MKKETEEWLKIAFEDYDAAKCLFERELYRMVCYHCQQAVENIKTDAIILPRCIRHFERKRRFVRQLDAGHKI